MLDWLTNNAISLIALIISCASFYRIYRLDRSDLIITDVTFNRAGNWGTCFRFLLINKGRRAITVKEVKLCDKSGTKIGMVVHWSEPIKLDGDGEQHASEITVSCEAEPRPENAVVIRAYETSGRVIREYKLARTLRAEVKQFCDQERSRA